MKVASNLLNALCLLPRMNPSSAQGAVPGSMSESQEKDAGTETKDHINSFLVMVTRLETVRYHHFFSAAVESQYLCSLGRYLSRFPSESVSFIIDPPQISKKEVSYESASIFAHGVIASFRLRRCCCKC